MNSIALAVITAYRVEVEAGHATPKGRARVGSETVKYSVRVDHDLYEWLRTTAFHARTSINALVVAALTRAHTDHAQGATATDV